MNMPRSKQTATSLLLVDDEVDYVNVLANRLKRRGFEVETATGGAEAIQAVRRRDFDVAVLDLKMEGMDGLEVLKVFQKMDERMVVIMLTGHGSQTAARDGIRFGAFDYLIKPCSLEDLLDKIGEARRQQTNP
ncbi:MAG: response regulator [Thermodesulfobacteriota bacterium]|nr:response regulator [Thermodesulfobacteriota bacterium]